VARTHPRRRRDRWAGAAVACVALLAFVNASAAQAADGVIDGTPMNVYANDVGRLQAGFDGVQSGEFYTGALMPNDGGLTAAIQPAAGAGGFVVFGRGGTPFTAVAPPRLSGDGSPSNPFRLTTAFNAVSAAAGPLLQVTEVVQYVNGTSDVTVTYTVGSATPNGLGNVRLYESASVLPASSYFATGFLVGAAPRRVGAQALGSGGVGGSNSLVEITPWTNFQEADASTIDSVVSATSASAPGFNNTVLATPTGNGAGLGAQWNIGALTANQTSTVAVTWHFSRTSALALAAISPTVPAGQTAQVTVSARNNDGGPDAGRNVVYTVTGANPTSGAVTTAADGSAVIGWLGAKTGTDTLTAFVDRDGNGAWDVNTEPRQIVTVTWTAAQQQPSAQQPPAQQPPPAPLPPPVPGKSVNVQVVSGQVFVKLAGGPRATGPPKGFVPLTAARQIPVGSQLDTRKGRVALTSAADTGKKTQKADFYQGIFQVKQALPKQKSKKAVALTTDIVLKGQLSRSQCAPLKRASAAAVDKKKGPKSVLGKLWGNGKGKFRTTGKYSAATVRGTIWLTQDECDGTLTKVQRGTVSVRDFKRKKTVTVKAGRSYLARAVRRR
jgi:hypothetical protein